MVNVNCAWMNVNDPSGSHAPHLDIVPHHANTLPQGELQEFDKLEAAARDADAVMHLGFIHDFTKYDESLVIDQKVIAIFQKALEGTNKTFIGMCACGINRACSGMHPIHDAPF